MIVIVIVIVIVSGVLQMQHLTPSQSWRPQVQIHTSVNLQEHDSSLVSIYQPYIITSSGDILILIIR